MPTIKRKTAGAETRAPFGAYNGPLPTNGNYPHVIRSVKLRSPEGKNQYLNVFAVLDAPSDSPKAEFNGFETWTKIVLDGSDAGLSRENSLYMAIAGKPDVAIEVDDGKPDPKVTKIGGVNPVNVRVLIDVKDNGEWGVQGEWIYPDPQAKTREAPAEQADADDAADDTVEAEAKPASRKRAAKKAPAAEASNVTPIRQEEAKDPDGMTIPELRAYAKTLGIETEGVRKPALLEAIKAKAGGEEQQPSESGKNPQDINGMDEDDLSEFLEEYGYGAGDFKTNDDGTVLRAEVIEVLAEDGVISPF